MIEMNIAYRYGVHYWKAACLNVDSGIIGDSDEGTKYGKIAKALSNFKEDILPPDVNKSEIGFTPDKKTGKILFGLKPIVGINSAIAQQIIDNRPYNNIMEFYEKNVKNGLLTDGKMVTLIKAGIFDQLYPDRKKLMYDFICFINPLKEKLTTTVIPKILNRIPQKYQRSATIYMFQKALKSNKTHDQFAEYYFTNYQELTAKKVTKKYPTDYNYNEDGKLVIELKVFEKVVKDKIEDLKEWLNSPEGLKAEAALRRIESWEKYCKGSVEHWEMESISFYVNDHELKDYPLSKYFDISSFYEMPREPEIVGYSSARGGKKWPKFKTYVIAGTVIDSLPKKGITTIISESGVVDIRVGKGKYQHYNKKIMVGEGNKRVNIDDTWFKRGTILVAVGYRRENDFYANSKNSSYQHSLMKIDGVDSNGELIIQQEKRRGEW